MRCDIFLGGTIRTLNAFIWRTDTLVVYTRTRNAPKTSLEYNRNDVVLLFSVFFLFFSAAGAAAAGVSPIDLDA